MNKNAESTTHITIIATSDLHGNLIGYRYEDGIETQDGLAKIQAYVQKVRQENPNIILIDGGDFLQGNPICAAYTPKKNARHPVIALMNFMHYDVATLGNHDFNYGMAAQQRALNQAKFKIVCANILDENDACLYTSQGYTIVERSGIKVAVIGVCTPMVQEWDQDKDGVAQLKFLPAWEGVQRALDRIKEKVDVIFVTAHMGIYPQYDIKGGNDSGKRIIDECPMINLLQVAHLHITVDDQYKGIPVAGVKNNGQELIRYDILLDAEKKIISTAAQIVSVEDEYPDEEVIAASFIKEAHETAKAMYALPDETDKGELLGFVKEDFQPQDAAYETRIAETPITAFLNQVQIEAAGADVSAVSFPKPWLQIKAGPFYEKDLSDLCCYDNSIYLLEVSGKQLLEYMEWNSACYVTMKQGDTKVAFDKNYPEFMQDYFLGVEYEIDITAPPGNRVKHAYFKGAPLSECNRIKLAVSNFRYSTVLLPNKIIENVPLWISDKYLKEYVRNYVKEHTPLSPHLNHNWRILR